MVERRSFKPCGPGSSPGRPTTLVVKRPPVSSVGVDEQVGVGQADRGRVGPDIRPEIGPDFDIERRQARVALDDIEASLVEVAAALARMG